MTLLEQYLATTDDFDPAECWVWPYGMASYGYGRARYGGKSHLAHRAVWLASGRSIPDGWVLDHRCLNKACVNPLHMEPVTNAENIRRGHQVTRAERAEHGLSVEQVAGMIGVSGRTIRRWAKDGSLPSVRTSRGGSRFKVSDVQAFIADGLRRAVPA